MRQRGGLGWCHQVDANFGPGLLSGDHPAARSSIDARRKPARARVRGAVQRVDHFPGILPETAVKPNIAPSVGPRSTADVEDAVRFADQEVIPSEGDVAEAVAALPPGVGEGIDIDAVRAARYPTILKSVAVILGARQPPQKEILALRVPV